MLVLLSLTDGNIEAQSDTTSKWQRGNSNPGTLALVVTVLTTKQYFASMVLIFQPSSD